MLFLVYTSLIYTSRSLQYRSSSPSQEFKDNPKIKEIQEAIKNEGAGAAFRYMADPEFQSLLSRITTEIFKSGPNSSSSDSDNNNNNNSSNDKDDEKK